MSNRSSTSALVPRVALFVLMFGVAWIVMTMTHELGHVLGGWLGGGKLTALQLSPLRLPYSLHAPDPHPQLTLWSGPILGVVAPLGVALIVRRWFTWFIADFCILANGVYLALAWWSGDRHLDTPRMLAAGVHPAWIAAFCAVTISVGYLRFRSDCLALFRRGRS